MDSDKTLYAIFSKTITITYAKSSNVITLSRENDTCNIYNKETSCEKTLPSVTLTNNDDYLFDGWYKGNEKLDITNNKYTFTENTTLIAKSKSVIKSYSEYVDSNGSWTSEVPDFHNDSIRNTVTEIEFVDLNDDNVNAPTINNTTSWDVSSAGDGSIIAWLSGTRERLKK